MAVYAVSDIHGYFDLFLKGLSEIHFSEGDFLWCLGDMIDRGPDGIKLLEHIMNHADMDLIIGNHELMFLNSVDESGKAICNGKEAYLWLDANGGRITFYQYKRLAENDRLKLLNWLRKRLNKRYCELTYSDVWNITWSSIWRDDSYTHALDIYSKYEHVFVTGHVPVQGIKKWQELVDNWNCPESVYHNNLVSIDGGCAMGSNDEVNNGLIFLRLNDGYEQAVRMN